MKRLGRIVLYVAIALVALLPVAITFTIGWRPFIGPRMRPVTDRRFASTPARLERGRYLVTSLNGCFACHSERDGSEPGAPPKIGREGAGKLFLSDPGLGTLFAPNITPDTETGLGNWSDDEIARAVREGVGRTGRALFPIMPYANYRHMSDEDLASVIVYLRSVPAVRNIAGTSHINFPINRLIMALPEPVTAPVGEPDVSTQRARGQHLVEQASCADCHSPQNAMGQRIAGLEFGGGNAIDSSNGKPVTALNITPDPSGIPYYDETTFINTMRAGQIGARKLDSAMPWGFYRNLTDDDLKAIWAFIHTLPPASHHVDNSTPPTMCRLCGYSHGLGDTNAQ